MGFVLKALAALISGHADPAYAQPWALRLALALGVWTLALLAARRATATACWLWFAGFAVASAWALPGLSPYFLFPSLVAAVALPFGIAWLPALASLADLDPAHGGGRAVDGPGRDAAFHVARRDGAVTLLPLLRAQPAASDRSAARWRFW